MLLDTDVLIDLIRGHAGASAWIRSLPILPDVSGYAAMELVAGCRNMLEINHVQQFLTQFQILWPEHIDLDRALHRYAPLSPTHGIGILDMLIATTAIAHSMPLVTFNVKHFKVIPISHHDPTLHQVAKYPPYTVKLNITVAKLPSSARTEPSKTA